MKQALPIGPSTHNPDISPRKLKTYVTSYIIIDLLKDFAGIYKYSQYCHSQYPKSKTQPKHFLHTDD